MKPISIFGTVLKQRFRIISRCCICHKSKVKHTKSLRGGLIWSSFAHKVQTLVLQLLGNNASRFTLIYLTVWCETRPRPQDALTSELQAEVCWSWCFALQQTIPAGFQQTQSAETELSFSSVTQLSSQQSFRKCYFIAPHPTLPWLQRATMKRKDYTHRWEASQQITLN